MLLLSLTSTVDAHCMRLLLGGCGLPVVINARRQQLCPQHSRRWSQQELLVVPRAAEVSSTFVVATNLAGVFMCVQHVGTAGSQPAATIFNTAQARPPLAAAAGDSSSSTHDCHQRLAQTLI